MTAVEPTFSELQLRFVMLVSCCLILLLSCLECCSLVVPKPSDAQYSSLATRSTLKLSSTSWRCGFDFCADTT